MSGAVLRYVEAIGRNEGEEKQHSHLYAVDEEGDHLPMCVYGWNRSEYRSASFMTKRSRIGRPASVLTFDPPCHVTTCSISSP